MEVRAGEEDEVEEECERGWESGRKKKCVDGERVCEDNICVDGRS
jgi:hypothetical protein